MAATMPAGSGGGASIRPGAPPPTTVPWYRRVPTPVLVVGGTVSALVVYIWWKRRGNAADEGTPVGPDSMGYYQYSQGQPQSSTTEIPGLESLTDAINRFIDGQPLDGSPGYEQPPNPVPAGNVGTGSGLPVATGGGYTTADVAAMFQRAGKEIEFAGSGETPEEGLARIARQLNLGLRSPTQVQSSINIRPR